MSRVALIRQENYGDGLKEKLDHMLDLTGAKQLFHSGDRVLLKPNFLKPAIPSSAVTTHPRFIAAIVELLSDMGCKVTVGDSPGWGTAPDVARKLGLHDLLAPYDTQIINFTRSGSERKGSTISQTAARFHLASELRCFDSIINLPKLKSHGQMGITLATKNLYGCVVGRKKAALHLTCGLDQYAFAGLLLEIASEVEAALHLMDGITGMDGNGPSSGRQRRFGVILASRSFLALDRVVVELIRHKPSAFPLFSAARRAGLSDIDLKQIQIIGESLDRCQIKDFKLPHSTAPSSISTRFQKLGWLFRPRLVVKASKCSSCGRCLKQCPAEAILIDNHPHINHTDCIRCFCCQEICPQGALTVKDSFWKRLIGKLTRVFH